jgi:hypothetical protein
MVEVKGMDSVDLPGLDDEPEDPENCHIETSLRVGPAGEDAGDRFKLFFATPRWLEGHLGADGFRVLQYTVVLRHFVWEDAARAAEALVGSVRAYDWEDFVESFGRLAYWEYSTEPPPLRLGGSK